MAFTKIISVSQEATYHTCPYKWFLERVKRLPRVDTPQIIFGRAMHKALETFNRAFRSGVTLPMDFLIFVFRKEMGRFMSEYWEFRARALLGLYLDRVASNFRPWLVEEQFYLPLEPGFVITGVIDLVTPDSRVIDYKVVRSVYAPDDRMQEACYYEGLRSMVDYTPTGHITVNLLREEMPARIQADVHAVTQNELDAFLERMLTFARGVRDGIFPKYPRARWCSRMWCSYWDSPCDHTASELDLEVYYSMYPEARPKRRRTRTKT